MLIKRELEPELKSSARQYPVVTITGPRQSGKTTLARRSFPRYRYVNLEEPDTRGLAQADPRAFLGAAEKGMILDEIQRVPELLSYIQSIVDNKKKKGQFILSLSIPELKKAKQDNSIDQYLLMGFHPRVYAEGLEAHKAYRNYFQTYIERDLRSLISVKDLRAFQKGLKHVRHVFKGKRVRAIVVYAGSKTQIGGEFSLLNYQDTTSIFIDGS